MPNQSTASISPINLMVLSAGRVSLPKMKPLRSIVATVHDLSGSTVKPDYDFWRFAQFLHAATPRLSTRRGLRLNVTGKIRTREAFVGSLNRVATQKPDLLVWWTFSPPLLPGKVSVAEIAERLFSVSQGGTAVIYPSTTGINALGPGMFAVGGVRADNGRLHSSVPPPGWIEVVPKVVTWNAWDRFREGWLGFGVPPAALPEQYPLETTHTMSNLDNYGCVASVLRRLRPKSFKREVADKFEALHRTRYHKQTERGNCYTFFRYHVFRLF